MKIVARFIPLVLLVLLFIACNKDEKKVVSDFMVFDEVGNFDFTIYADNITATITLVGGGGGGAGGVMYNNNNQATGGGGGGGAGEVKIFENVILDRNVVYVASVGAGGEFGPIGVDGLSGQASQLLQGGVLFNANPGEGGKTHLPGNKHGGEGGTGSPNGEQGGEADTVDSNGTGAGGTGGLGGDNESTFGIGGNGGTGASLLLYNLTESMAGLPGQNGYIVVEWEGEF